jgi:hypothetical protein
MSTPKRLYTRDYLKFKRSHNASLGGAMIYILMEYFFNAPTDQIITKAILISIINLTFWVLGIFLWLPYRQAKYQAEATKCEL